MKKKLLAFLGFSVLAVGMTYPLFFKINNHVAGFFSTDEPSIWYYWWLKYCHIHNISSSFSGFVAAPFGIDLSVAEMITPVWTGFTKFLVIIGSECFTYNVQVLITFVLSAFFVYLMAAYLMKSRIAAFFSGIIFAFCPFHFVRSWQHLNLAYTQWLPLFLFALFLLRDKVSKYNIVLAVLSLYLVLSFDLYYGYFSLTMAMVFIIYLLVKEQKKSFKVVLWIAIVSLINLAILSVRLRPLLRTIKTDILPSAWGFVRPFDDLFSQSARPLSFFLPDSSHPLFGSFTEQLVGSKLYGTSFTEHALYLGWTPLVLAFIAFNVCRRRKKEIKAGRVPIGKSPCSTENFYIGFFVLLAAVAWFFSQPPWWNIFGLKIYMPSFFMYKVLPMFRAYCRFGIVLMLAVAVLAGFGLKFILERFKTRKARICIAVFLCGLVLFEFWNWPPYKVIDYSEVPAVYHWLKAEAGDFAVAEYPLDTLGPSEKYKFFQTVHEKKIINGTIPSTYANKVSQTITKLSEAHAAGVLKWMGVRYALVHTEEYIKTELTEWADELNKIPQNLGLKFIKRFSAQGCPEENIMCVQETGPIDVYEIIALPIETEVKK